MDRLADLAFHWSMTTHHLPLTATELDAGTSGASGTLRLLTWAAVLGAGLAAGVFFAFSTFVTAGLRQLPAREGIDAMNAINRTAPTAAFMTLLFGTAAVAVVIGLAALRHLDTAGGRWRLAGAACYLIAIVMTAAYHVPHNNALALVDSSSAGAPAYWKHWISSWVALNHVRTLACTLSAAAFLIAARLD
jgi:uncharacterized membrane protein